MNYKNKRLKRNTLVQQGLEKNTKEKDAATDLASSLEAKQLKTLKHDIVGQKQKEKNEERNTILSC